MYAIAIDSLTMDWKDIDTMINTVRYHFLVNRANGPFLKERCLRRSTSTKKERIYVQYTPKYEGFCCHKLTIVKTREVSGKKTYGQRGRIYIELMKWTPLGYSPAMDMTPLHMEYNNDTFFQILDELIQCYKETLTSMIL